MEVQTTTSLTRRQRKAFAVARRAAQQVLRRRFRVLRLVRVAYQKMGRHETMLAGLLDDLGVLLRLSRAWACREYRLVPWRSVLFAVAAIVYFVNPADLLPDVIAGLGFVDDAAVVGAVVRAIQVDLDHFRAWEGRPALPETRQVK